MRCVIVTKLPVGGEGLGDVEICSDGCNLTVKYEYRENGRDLIGTISFALVCHFRYAGEMCGTFINCSYDTLCIVEESDWLAEATLRSESDWIVEAKHYALYLSNNGYLEVIASSAVQGPTREGVLAVADEA